MAFASVICTPISAEPEADSPRLIDAAKGDRSFVPLVRFDISKLEYDRINFGPDADGDGLPELLATAGWNSDGFASIALVSSKTGQPYFCRADYVGLLHSERTAPRPLTWDAGGDVDGDGVRDILFGAPERSLVVLLSGKDGRLLRSFRGKAAGFGDAFSLGPDIDGDGKSDLAVGSPGARLVQLFSGQSGRELDSWNGPRLKAFGRLVVLRAYHGKDAMLAIASESQSFLFDPKGDKEPLFIFGDVDSRQAPHRLSLASDIDGDGFRDFVAASWGTSGPSGVFSIHFRKLLGFYDAVPFADVDGNGRLDWIYADRSGPLMFGTDDGSPFSENMRNLKAVMPVPTYLTAELKQNRWDVDESGRYLLTWSDGGDTLTLYSIGGRGQASPAAPPLVPVPPPECPLLFPPKSDFPFEAEAALNPTLSRLAENLGTWGKASEAAWYPTRDKAAKTKTAALRAAAGQALAKIADPQAGLWFWENAGVVAIPSVRFPPSSRQRSFAPPIAMAASEAASRLRTALGQPNFARTVTRSPVVIADLLHNLDDHDEDRRLDRSLLRSLPIQAKIRLGPSSGSDDDPWSLEIYLTVRGQRLYVAHVIYQDGSA